MTATGTGAGELRERLALALGQAIGLSPEREIEWMPVTRKQADTAISVLAPAGGTLTAEDREAVTDAAWLLDVVQRSLRVYGYRRPDTGRMVETDSTIATLKAIVEWRVAND